MAQPARSAEGEPAAGPNQRDRHSLLREDFAMKRAWIMEAIACVLAIGAIGSAAKAAPRLLALDSLKLQIVDAMFVTKLTGLNAAFQEGQPEKFRGLVVTLRIEKKPGEAVELCAQDLTLHYRYGTKNDVAICHGLSTFSAEEKVDRPMKLFAKGYGYSSTGPSTSRAPVVYVDLFFMFMEPNTSDIHLCVARPTGASFQTQGWK